MRNVAVRFSAIVSFQRSSGELPERHVLGGVDAGDGRADVDVPEGVARLVEQAVDVRLDREVGLGDRHAAELVGQCPRALLTAMEVDEDPGALRREGSRAGRADAAGGAGDDDALAVKTGLDPLRLLGCACTSSATWKVSPASSSGSRRRAASRCTRRGASCTRRRSTQPCAARRRPARRRSSSWTATAPARAGRSTRSSPRTSIPRASSSSRTSGRSTRSSSSRAATPRSSSGCTHARAPRTA